MALEKHAHHSASRDYATTIGEHIVKPLFPIVWEAFQDYRVGGMFLTRLDSEVLARLMTQAQETRQSPPFEESLFLDAQDPNWKTLTRCRERDECHDKLAGLGIVVPRDVH